MTAAAPTRVFDLAAWGRLAVEGSDAADLLDRLLSQEIRSMAPGDVRPACLLDERGRVRLVLDVVRRGASSDLPRSGSFLLLVDPGCRDRAAPELERYVVMEDVRMTSVGGPHLHVAGPGAAEVLGRLGLAAPPAGRAEGSVVGVRRTSADGYDIVGGPGLAAVAAAGAEVAGADSLDALRIEAGIPRYGREADETTIALEAGLGGACVTSKCYVGQEVIARVESRGHVNRALARLALSAPLEAGAPLLDASGAEVGRVTSAAGLRALGLVRREAAAAGTVLRAGGVEATLIGASP